MLFSVVVPTCERSRAIADCLARLAPGCQTVDSADYEVIVSDDGRTDATRGLIAERFPWAIWNGGPRLGPATNRNCGARIARGDWLVFTDDDCLPDPEWLAGYQSAIRDCSANVALEGAVQPSETIVRPSERCPVNVSGGRFWSANIAVRRDAFTRVGGFSPMFPYAASEDQDLYYQLQEFTNVPFVASAIVKHPVSRPTVGQLVAAIRPMVYSYTLLCLRHPRRTGGGTFTTRVAAGAMFHLGIVKRSIRALDWRAAVVSAAYLTWGSIWGWWYHVTLKASVASVEGLWAGERSA